MPPPSKTSAGSTAAGERRLPPDPATFYITSPEDFTLTQLARLYGGRKGCARSTLETRSSKEKWRERRQEHREKVARQAEEKIAAKRADHVVDAVDDYQRGRSLGRVGMGLAARLMNEATRVGPDGRLLHANSGTMMRQAIELADRATAIVDRCARGAAELSPRGTTQYADLMEAARTTFQERREAGRAMLEAGRARTEQEDDRGESGAHPTE